MKRPVKPFLVEVKRSRSELGPVKAPAFRLQETAPIPQGGALNHRHAAASALFEPVARDAPAPSPQAAPGQGRILPSLVAMTPPAEIAVSSADEPQAEAKRVRRQNRKTAANGALKNGVDPMAFMTTYNSFGVQAKSQQARQTAAAYKIDAVPAMGVQGRYYTNGNLANAGLPPGPVDRMLGVVDTLVAKVRQASRA